MAKFAVHLSSNREYFGKPFIPAIRAVYSGVWSEKEQEILTVDKDELRKILPHYYRKAFDNDPTIWADSRGFLNVHLTSKRGKYLNTVYLYLNEG